MSDPELPIGQPPRRRHRTLLLALAGLILALQWVAIRQQSLTFDEPYHLLAGHQALRYGHNRLNLEHPPLVKMVAALSTLGDAPWAGPVPVTGALAAARELFDHPAQAHRLRLRGRWLVLLAFGLPWLSACYLLGREAGGELTGVVLAGVVGLSFSTLPYLALMQTDTAVALGATLVAAGGLRYLRQPSRGAAIWVGLGLGVALASKFSGLLFVPAALLPFALAKRPAAGPAGPGAPRRPVLDGAGACLLAIGLLFASFGLANRAYEAEAGRATLREYCRGQATLIVGERMRDLERGLLAAERVSPSLAQWLTGFAGVRAQNAIGVYPSYAFGRVDSHGRWWYFPVTWLLKTPLAILAATLAFFLLRRGRRRPSPCDRPRLAGREWSVVLAGGGLYLAFALGSSYNVGARHLLPALPMLFLPAALWAGAKRERAITVLAVLALEGTLLSPLWMSATNTWWLGAANPTRFALADSSGEYGQSLLTLARELEARQIERVGILMPATSRAEVRAYLPDAYLVTPGERLEHGWYAVSVMLEQLVPAVLAAGDGELYAADGYRRLAEGWQPALESARRGTDHGYVAGTYHLFYLEPRP